MASKKHFLRYSYLLPVLVSFLGQTLLAQSADDVAKALAEEETKLAAPQSAGPAQPAPSSPTTPSIDSINAPAAAPQAPAAENATANAPMPDGPKADDANQAPPIAVPVPVPVQQVATVLPKFEYNPNQRRDPFAPPLLPPSELPKVPVAKTEAEPTKPRKSPPLPLESFDVEQLRLSAILWDVARPKAMIKDPGGGTHIVFPNQRIGRNNGYVAVIREGEIVVVEPLQDEGRVVFSTKLLRLHQQ
jgi:type IV pilus assembly protein PilP